MLTLTKSSQINITPVMDSRSLHGFVSFPLKLYKNNPNYVPSLNRGEYKNLATGINPTNRFCEHKLWLAHSDGKVVGRIAGIVNRRYIEQTGKKLARFSWLDFIDDPGVAGALFDAFESWVIDKGMEGVMGPYGFTNLDPHGLLIEGFDELATSSSNYNFPYYRDIIENLHYVKMVDWVEYRINVPAGVPDKMLRVADIAEQRYGLSIARISSQKDLLIYKDEFFDLLNLAYSGLCGVVPLDDAQKENLYNGYFKYLDPRYVSLILDGDNRLAAFGISVPSISRALQKSHGKLWPFGIYHLWRAMKKNDTIDLLLIGVRPDLQNKGVNSILFRELIPRYIENGIKFVESTQNQDDNLRVQAQWKYFESRQHKRSRCYVKYF